MRIFVLDDDQDRLNWFAEEFGDIVTAKTVNEAIEILRNNKFDVIFLDHDLGGAFKSGPDGDGIDVAEVMPKEKLQTYAEIIIQSRNPRGARNIYDVLMITHHNRELIPYPYLRYFIDKGKFNNEPSN